MSANLVKVRRGRPAGQIQADFAQALVPLDLRDDPSTRGSRILQHFFATLTNRYTRMSYAEDFRVFATFMRGVYHTRLSPAQVVDCFLFGGNREQHRTHHAHANVAAEAFRQWQLKLDRASATINRRLAMLRNLTAAGRRLGYFPWSLEITSLRSETRVDTRGPVTADVVRLLDHLKGTGTPIAVRDVAIIRLLHDLGLRRGEVVKLDVSDLNPQDQTLAVRGKGRRESERLTAPDATWGALCDWLDVRGRMPGPLFLLALKGRHGGGRFTTTRITGFAIYKQIRLYGRALGLKLRPHGFRHTSITSAMIAAGQSGVPFEEVMQFSRHRQITTLMRYRDFLQNRQPELANAVAKTLAEKKPR